MAVLLAGAVAMTTIQGAPPVDLEDVGAKTEQVTGTLRHYCPPSCTVDESIRDAASTYGLSYTRLSCLARRESTYNPAAVNGRYMGLYQFDAPTWQLTPYGESSPFNAWAAAHGAAYLIARGEGSRWPPLGYC
jgi:hypothetical protein